MLKQECTGVVGIPDKGLTAYEAVRLWAKDRERLGDCARRHSGLVDAVEEIEGQGAK